MKTEELKHNIIAEIEDGLFFVDTARIYLDALLNGQPNRVVRCLGNPNDVVKYIGPKSCLPDINLEEELHI